MRNKPYMNKVRLRSCGLLVENEKLLLVEVLSPVTNNWTWIAPGGGVEFGESLEETVKREFLEETGLSVTVRYQAHIHQIIEPPIHAVEFYYFVSREDGKPALGMDPELKEEEQILRDIGYFSREEIQHMNVSPPFLKDDLWHNIPD